MTPNKSAMNGGQSMRHWSPNDTDMATKSQGWRWIETGKGHKRPQIYKT